MTNSTTMTTALAAKPGTMNFVPTSDPINIDSMIGLLDSDDLREILTINPPRLDFPIGWDFGDDRSDGRHGPPPSDPVTLYLELPFAEQYDHRVCYSCSLEGVIDDLIDGHISPASGKIEDTSSKNICARVAARLRELAAKLDDACAPDEQGDEASR